MAAINLDSLNTFWQSIKTYFAGRLLSRNTETVLYEDPTGVGTSTTVQLSSALRDGYTYRITFRTNDNCGYTQELKFYSGVSTNFFLLNFYNNVGSTARSYIKIARLEIASDNRSLTITCSTQTHLNASGVTSSSTTTNTNFFITKITEYQP